MPYSKKAHPRREGEAARTAEAARTRAGEAARTAEAVVVAGEAARTRAGEEAAAGWSGRRHEAMVPRQCPPC